jgi:hypothetical protein
LVAGLVVVLVAGSIRMTTAAPLVTAVSVKVVAVLVAVAVHQAR